MSLSDTKNSDSTTRTSALSLRRNFSWTFVGDFTFAFCQWAILAVLAKLGTPEIVGNYSFALAVTAPVLLFANMNLRAVIATDARKAHTFGEYFGLRLVMLAVSCIVLAIIVAVIHPGWFEASVIGLITLAKVFDSLSDIMYGLQQLNERMDYISISRIIQGVLQTALLAIVLELTGNLILSIAVFAIASGLVTVLYDVGNAARMCLRGSAGPLTLRQMAAAVAPSWEPAPFKALVVMSLPLAFVAVFGMLNVNVPRYFVQDYIGARGLGIFSAMWSMLAPLGLATGAIMQPLLPRLARAYQDDLNAYKRILRLMFVCYGATAVAGIIGAHFFGRFILSILFRPIYASHPVAFEWIMVSAGLVYMTSVCSAAIDAARSFKLQPYVILCAVVANAAACSLLIPRYGEIGAAWSYCVGCGMWLAGFALLAGKALKAGERRLCSSAAPVIQS